VGIIREPRVPFTPAQSADSAKASAANLGIEIERRHDQIQRYKGEDTDNPLGSAGWDQMNISEPFIYRPVATSLLAAALAFVGIAAFPFLPVASLPQIDFPTIQITATLAGASAEIMAVSVATPLERQLSQIPGVTQMASLSTLGATQVVVQFDLNRNIDAAAQDVQAAISVAGKTLPQSLTIPPTYRKVNPADPPILILGGRSETLPLPRINEYLDSFLAQQISQIPGVAQASIGGDRRPSIRIQVDPAMLASIGLTLEEIRTAIVNATTASPKGTLNTEDTGFIIAANDQITDAELFNDVILAYRNGAPIRVRDVGQAVADASNVNLAGYQNNQLGVLLNVSKQPGANVIDTVDQIKAQLPRLTANLPPALKIQTILDRTETIRASVHDVEFTLMLTIGLVVIVILIFLRNLWAILIPGMTIPLALLGSFAAMYALNFSLNNLSLMALTIAVGFVVDDAIVVVENIYRHVEHGSSVLDAALKGSREIACGPQGITRNRIHGVVDQPVPRSCIHSALAHGRHHRTDISRIRFDGHGFDHCFRYYLAVARAHALFSPDETSIRRPRPTLSYDRKRLRYSIIRLFANARHCAAPPSHHVGRVLRHLGVDGRVGVSNSQGLFSDSRHRTNYRCLRGGAGCSSI
jgi:hypothetical protein